MVRGDIIFLGQDKYAGLMCEVTKVTADNIHFNVVNGGWAGIFHIDKKEAYVCETRYRYPQEIVYDIQDRIRGDYNVVLTEVNRRLASGQPCLRGHTPEDRSTDIWPPAFRSDTADEKIGQAGKLRRVLLSPTRYLAIDIRHREVRLFERQGKKNVMIRRMPI